ncbi:hypothetical protein GGX14DRAFT_358195 [Mycena pura]|uniref:G domain-containing protein n=1 Tax=Mycena pura TaxID=153505 RepID=A0AAD6VQZ1_9AGAR|nr:hypothetical protein GGX14DRAFT_358195 [Mycena pura]
MEKAIDIHSRCQRYCVLVVGRADAGKTTLLKKVSNSIEDLEIFGSEGEMINVAMVGGPSERGLHTENQLIFKNIPRFIFHDSRGFQGGSVLEMERVKAFITERASKNTLSDKLHVIWYCLPTDSYMQLSAAEVQFFNTDIAGKGKPPILLADNHTKTLKVPIIVIFTKFHGLAIRAYIELQDEMSLKEAKKRMTEKALEMLTTEFIEPLKSMRFPPSDFVRLEDMLKETSNCDELIEKTVKVLSNTLGLLFVSVQQNNIDFCMQYAVRE